MRCLSEFFNHFSTQPDNPNIVVTPDYERGQIAGIRKEDLVQLDPAKPIPDGMTLVAWALLGEPKSWGFSTLDHPGERGAPQSFV